MVEGIIIGVVGTVVATLILAVLASFAGVFRAPRNVDEWKVVMRRAKTDYEEWRRQYDADVEDQLRKLDADHARRNTYGSGPWIADKKRIIEKTMEDSNVEVRKMTRKIDDAFRELRTVDRVWMVWTMENRKMGFFRATWKALRRPASMEETILDPLIEKARSGELLESLKKLKKS